MDGARKMEPQQPNHFTPQFIDAFVTGVTQTFKVMSKTTIRPEKPILGEALPQNGDVVGMVGLIGNGSQGMLMISFDKDILFYFLKEIFDQEYTEIDDDVTDAVGELTNVIYGSTKTILNNLGYKFEMAIPSVVTGVAYFTASRTDHSLCIPFSSDHGRLTLGIALR